MSASEVVFQGEIDPPPSPPEVSLASSVTQCVRLYQRFDLVLVKTLLETRGGLIPIVPRLFSITLGSGWRCPGYYRYHPCYCRLSRQLNAINCSRDHYGIYPSMYALVLKISFTGGTGSTKYIIVASVINPLLFPMLGYKSSCRRPFVQFNVKRFERR